MSSQAGRVFTEPEVNILSELSKVAATRAAIAGEAPYQEPDWSTFGETASDQLEAVGRPQLASVREGTGTWPQRIGAGLASTEVPPDNRGLEVLQRYLVAPPPEGVDLNNVHHVDGATGTYVRLVDIEKGWRLDHEDLNGNINPNPLAGENVAFKEHGASVLSILAATGDRGFRSLIPEAKIWLASHRYTDDPPVVSPLAYALLKAIVHLEHTRPEHAADIILLEAQTKKYQPVEFIPHIGKLIELATALGITVVEPTGNDEKNGYGGALPENYADAGAILVTGFDPRTGDRMAACWRGPRVDCFMPGVGVITIDPSKKSGYSASALTASSAAAALVAGIVGVFQSAHVHKYGRPMRPLELRERIRGLEGSEHATEQIGRQLDLTALFHGAGLLERPPQFGHVATRLGQARVATTDHGSTISVENPNPHAIDNTTLHAWVSDIATLSLVGARWQHLGQVELGSLNPSEMRHVVLPGPWLRNDPDRAILMRIGHDTGWDPNLRLTIPADARRQMRSLTGFIGRHITISGPDPIVVGPMTLHGGGRGSSFRLSFFENPPDALAVNLILGDRLVHLVAWGNPVAHGRNTWQVTWNGGYHVDFWLPWGATEEMYVEFRGQEAAFDPFQLRLRVEQHAGTQLVTTGGFVWTITPMENP